MKYLILPAFICVLYSPILAQDKVEDRVVVLSSQPIDPNRYNEIRHGSAYLYGEFVPATILDKNRLETPNVLLNYNGYSGEFEFKYDDKIIELDKRFYLRFELVSDLFSEKEFRKTMSDTTTFVKAINPDDYNEFYIQVYGGTKASVFKKFEVKKVTRKVENVGETIVHDNFAPLFYYWLVKSGNREPLRLNKRNVLKALDNRDVSAFVKDNNLSLDNEKDLIKVLKYYETL